MPLTTVGIIGVMSLVLLMLTHMTTKFYLEHRRNKPWLLVLDDKTGDSSRLKRLRYACTNAFDSWYEQIDVESPEAVQRSIDEPLPNFDGVCLLEGVGQGTQEEYVRAAAKRGIDLFVVPILFDMIYSNLQLVNLDDVLGFHMRPYRFSALQSAVKRVMDIAMAGLLLTVTLVPMLISVDGFP